MAERTSTSVKTKIPATERSPTKEHQPSKTAEHKKKPAKKAEAKAKTKKKPSSKKTEDSKHVQASIREYFPVRRSTRKPKSVIEKEKNDLLRDRLLNKDESGLKTIDIEVKGKGVVSSRPFLKGELVCEYSGEHISMEEAKKREESYGQNDSVGCYMYYFEHKGTWMCVDATEDNGRLGRLLNHSKTAANVVTKLVVVEDKPYLCLLASRDIEVGEELQYDYGERDKEAIKHHPWLTT